MRKTITYLTALLALTLFACQDDNETDKKLNPDKTILEVTMNIPEYRISTRSVSFENDIQDIWVLVFDSNGLFIERVHATELVCEESGGVGSGSFKIEVSKEAAIIHVIANCDQWALFDDKANLQKDEKEVVPTLFGTRMVFWGRSEVNTFDSPVNVILFRNKAKVTVQNEADNFEVTGYALGHISTAGTVAPFVPGLEPNPFIISEDATTMPQGTVSKMDQTEAECTIEPKYMFENPNYFNDQSYIIIKGRIADGPELYYKIEFLDNNKQPYPLVRNFQYNVLIKSFSDSANGTTSFEEAKTAEVSNNIYAEILRDSPTISDSDNNRLTVGRIHTLFTQGGTLEIPVHYTENEVPNDSKIEVSIQEDRGNILSNLSYDGYGNITARVARVTKGQKEATISVKAGILSRTLIVTSSELYSFAPFTISPEIYTHKDQDIILSFRIPKGLPNYLYPLKCLITTKKLYPTEPNKDLQIDYSDGIYKYLYWAEEPGAKSLNFRTSLDNSNEVVSIENEYFKTASVNLVSHQFDNLSVNSNNLVAYGEGNTAVLRFTLSESADYPPSYPLTVFVATNNLQTSQSGWIAVDGGYSYTFNEPPAGEQTVEFVSTQAASGEKLVISAPGFSKGTVSFDNYLTEDTYTTGDIDILGAAGIFPIPRYPITSSDHSIVDDFKVTIKGKYEIYIKKGSKLLDTVTFKSYSYYGSFTVKDIVVGKRLDLH